MPRIHIVPLINIYHNIMNKSIEKRLNRRLWYNPADTFFKDKGKKQRLLYAAYACIIVLHSWQTGRRMVGGYQVCHQYCRKIRFLIMRFLFVHYTVWKVKQNWKRFFWSIVYLIMWNGRTLPHDVNIFNCSCIPTKIKHTICWGRIVYFSLIWHLFISTTQICCIM